MNTSILKTPLKPSINEEYQAFLSSQNLADEADADVVALMRDEDFRIIACGARADHVLKQFAVSPDIEAGGACASIMSELLNEASREGVSRLFLCTKPANKAMFASMGFYPVIATPDAVLMEDRKNGFEDFLASIPRHTEVEAAAHTTEAEETAHPAGSEEHGAPVIGAIVMNANPFTLGHLHLVEYAAANSDTLYLFVVSDKPANKSSMPADLLAQEDAPADTEYADKGKDVYFTPEERYEMVANGTAHIKNLILQKSDAYLVSRATFPAYFIQDRTKAEDVKTDIDTALFAERIAPALGITMRFVGEEPFSPVTAKYNERMKEVLPAHGIQLIEIPRFQEISASKVRALIAEGRVGEIKDLVPETTYDKIAQKFCKRRD